MALDAPAFDTALLAIVRAQRFTREIPLGASPVLPVQKQHVKMCSFLVGVGGFGQVGATPVE